MKELKFDMNGNTSNLTNLPIQKALGTIRFKYDFAI